MKAAFLFFAVTQIPIFAADISLPNPVLTPAGVSSQQIVGKPLDLRFVALDGRKIDSSQLQGKVILIDCWASWCAPCVAEIPRIKRLYDIYHTKGLEVVGISFDEDRQRLEEFLKSKDVRWPQYFDGKGWSNEFGRQFKIQSIPLVWLIDRQGNLVDTNARGGLEEKLSRLLAVGQEVGIPVGEPAPIVTLEKFRETVETKTHVILDARPNIFYRVGHVPGALSLPRDEFDTYFGNVEGILKQQHDSLIFIYCQSTDCEDASLVAKKLGPKGFPKTAVFAGGWNAWTQANLPTQK